MKRIVVVIAMLVLLAGCAKHADASEGKVNQADQMAKVGESLTIPGATLTVYAVESGEAYGPKPIAAADIKICVDEATTIKGDRWTITGADDRTLTPGYLTTDDFTPLYPMDETPLVGGACFRGWLPMEAPAGFAAKTVDYTWGQGEGDNDFRLYHLVWMVG